MDSRKLYDVYLSLGMHSRPVGEVLAQMDSAKRLCDYYGLSYYAPTDDEGLEHLEFDAIIDHKPDLILMEHYVAKDDRKLDQCRSILVLTGDINSSGTLWEQARAFYKCEIPIALVAPLMSRGELTNFTTIKADFICATQEEAVSLLANYLSIKE